MDPDVCHVNANRSRKAECKYDFTDHQTPQYLRMSARVSMRMATLVATTVMM